MQRFDPTAAECATVPSGLIMLLACVRVNVRYYSASVMPIRRVGKVWAKLSKAMGLALLG